jgi:hypothetical protein
MEPALERVDEWNAAFDEGERTPLSLGSPHAYRHS